MGVRAPVGVAMAVLCACAREPEAFVCPEIGAGDLVVTELRGSGGTYGQWVEVQNGSDGPIDMRGIQLLLQRTSGSGLTRIIVRADALVVEAGERVVLGHHEPGEVPGFVDYSFFSDFFVTSEDDPTPLGPRELYESGVLQVVACGEVVDRVVYPTLPDAGTWSLDGALEPDDVVNDDPFNWCTDDFDPGATSNEIGLPGTPGAPNRACVE
jgi:hypothetical protein